MYLTAQIQVRSASAVALSIAGPRPGGSVQDSGSSEHVPAHLRVGRGSGHADPSGRPHTALSRASSQKASHMRLSMGASAHPGKKKGGGAAIAADRLSVRGETQADINSNAGIDIDGCAFHEARQESLDLSCLE
jgi:hypothetical protein